MSDDISRDASCRACACTHPAIGTDDDKSSYAQSYAHLLVTFKHPLMSTADADAFQSPAMGRTLTEVEVQSDSDSSIDDATITGGPPVEKVCSLSPIFQWQLRPADGAACCLQVNPLGREVTLLSAVMLNLGQLLGSGIFSVPGIVLDSVGSVGLSLAFWAIAPVFALGSWLPF